MARQTKKTTTHRRPPREKWSFKDREPIAAQWVRPARAPYVDPKSLPENSEQRRRWEAAQSTRLNAAHWAPVNDRSINADLGDLLATMRARCIYEQANNGYVKHAIDTLGTDVVGQYGPTLRVQPADSAYTHQLERIWADWWAHPDVRGRSAGVEILKQCIRLLPTCGEYLVQITKSRRRGADELSLRLKTIHPRRLDQPTDRMADDYTNLGIQTDADGRPLTYYIVTDSTAKTAHTPVKARYIYHLFEEVEPDQLRGWPWLATCLEEIADLRDFDAEVLDAARMAADNAVLLQTRDPNLDPVEVNESTEIERRTISTLPPGWEARQMVPQQPATSYVEYHRERLRPLGLAMGQPLMILLADASNANYSSARFDDQTYGRGIQDLQAWTGRAFLSPLLAEVEQEARRLGLLKARRPAEVKVSWLWPKRPHVDPYKERMADKVALDGGFTDLGTVAASSGTDEDDLIAARKATNEKLAAAGLPPMGPTGPAV